MSAAVNSGQLGRQCLENRTDWVNVWMPRRRMNIVIRCAASITFSHGAVSIAVDLEAD